MQLLNCVMLYWVALAGAVRLIIEDIKTHKFFNEWYGRIEVDDGSEYVGYLFTFFPFIYLSLNSSFLYFGFTFKPHHNRQ